MAEQRRIVEIDDSENTSSITADVSPEVVSDSNENHNLDDVLPQIRSALPGVEVLIEEDYSRNVMDGFDIEKIKSKCPLCKKNQSHSTFPKCIEIQTKRENQKAELTGKTMEEMINIFDRRMETDGNQDENYQIYVLLDLEKKELFGIKVSDDMKNYLDKCGKTIRKLKKYNGHGTFEEMKMVEIFNTNARLFAVYSKKKYQKAKADAISTLITYCSPTFLLPKITKTSEFVRLLDSKSTNIYGNYFLSDLLNPENHEIYEFTKIDDSDQYDQTLYDNVETERCEHCELLLGENDLVTHKKHRSCVEIRNLVHDKFEMNKNETIDAIIKELVSDISAASLRIKAKEAKKAKKAKEAKENYSLYALFDTSEFRNNFTKMTFPIFITLIFYIGVSYNPKNRFDEHKEETNAMIYFDLPLNQKQTKICKLGDNCGQAYIDNIHEHVVCGAEYATIFGKCSLLTNMIASAQKVDTMRYYHPDILKRIRQYYLEKLYNNFMSQLETSRTDNANTI